MKAESLLTDFKSILSVSIIWRTELHLSFMETKIMGGYMSRELCRIKGKPALYTGVSKSFRTGRLERELQMVQVSATRCSCIAIL